MCGMGNSKTCNCTALPSWSQRDVPAGEELTYDYRFSGDEKLPCNCGARLCRGFVNVPEEHEHDAGVLVVPRSQLTWVSGPAATRA